MRRKAAAVQGPPFPCREHQGGGLKRKKRRHNLRAALSERLTLRARIPRSEGSRDLSMDCAGSLLTRPHATSTGLSTDPAVLVVGSMTLALLAAQAAGCGAHFQHPPDDLLVGACAASGNGARGIADVGAVQAQSDGLSQVLNIVSARLASAQEVHT